MSTSLHSVRKPLCHEFCKLMTERRAWPSGPTFLEWVRDVRGDTMKTSTYTKLRRGEPVELRFVRLLVDFELHAGNDAEESRVRQNRFHAVLLSTGIKDPFALSADGLVAAIIEPDRDALAGGLAALEEALSKLPDHRVEANATLDEIELTNEWMYTQLGRTAAGDNADISDETATFIAEAVVGISQEDYLRRALAWQKRVPWSVVPVRSANTLIGGTIVLPLRQDIYKRVRCGEAMASDVRPNEFAFPSRHLFLESAAYRPSVPPDDAYHLTPYVILTFDSQISRLSFTPDVFHKPLHLLSRISTPRGERRLRSYSFKETGTYEAKTGLPLMELRLEAHDKGDKRLLRALLTMLAEQLVEST